MPLDKDNPTLRTWSDKLDNKFGDSNVWNKLARPVVHGAYHGGRCVVGNPAECARSKDQFSKFGTGQAKTEYLKEHRAQEAQDKK